VEGPFFTGLLYGIIDEAQKHGYHVTALSAGGYPNVDKQVSQIEDLTSKKADIILVNPSDPNTLKHPVQAAVASGVTVVGAGDPLPGSNGSVTVSSCDVGKSFAEGAKQLLPNGGTVGVLAGPPGAFWATERLRCFKEGIKGTALKIVAEKTSDADVAVGLSTASDFLQRFPKLDLLYGADDTVGDGAAKAAQAANRCGKTKVITSVFSPEDEALMKAGCLDFDVALQSVLVGRTSVQLALGLRDKSKPDQTNEISLPISITTGNLGTVDLSTVQPPSGWKPPI
jgi:ribose transport system substrate-binding protein